MEEKEEGESESYLSLLSPGFHPRNMTPDRLRFDQTDRQAHVLVGIHAMMVMSKMSPFWTNSDVSFSDEPVEQLKKLYAIFFFDLHHRQTPLPHR